MSHQSLEKKPLSNSAKIWRFFWIALLLIVIGTVLTVLLQPRRSNPLALAQAAYLEGNYEEALDYFSAAIAQNPNDAEAFIGRGLVYVQAGQSENAQNDFLRARELDASDYRPVYQLGMIASGLGQFPSAIAYFNDTLSISADFAPAYFARAYAHAQSANFLLAIEDYNAAIALDNTQADFYRGLGDAHYALDNTAEALAAYERYIELAEEVDGTVFQRVLDLRNRGVRQG